MIPNAGNTATTTMTINRARVAINIEGLPEAPISGLRISDVIASGKTGMKASDTVALASSMRLGRPDPRAFRDALARVATLGELLTVLLLVLRHRTERRGGVVGVAVPELLGEERVPLKRLELDQRSQRTGGLLRRRGR